MENFNLRKYLAEGKLLKEEETESFPLQIETLKDLGYDIKSGDGNRDAYHISKDGDYLAIVYARQNTFTDINTKKSYPWQGVGHFNDVVTGVVGGSEDKRNLLDFFHFTKYVDVDEKALADSYEYSFEDMRKDLEDEMDIEQIKKEWTYENGSDFLDTNEDKISEYLGFEIDASRMSDDYTMGDPMGVEFVHSDDDFEGWMDEVGEFWD